MSARKLAVTLLDQTEEKGSYSNIALDAALDKSELDARDKRLCAALYYGVLERKLTLDYIISRYSKKPPEKLDGIVLQIIRTGLYQLLFMEHIPDTAAVSESVKLTKKCRKASASGFVNAVLRSFIRDGKKIEYPQKPYEKASVMYSVPVWLVKKIYEKYGEEEGAAFFEDALQPPPLTIRRNPLRATEDELMAVLADAGIEKHPLVPDAYVLRKGGNIRSSEAFEKGWFHVQDTASQLCVMALGAEPDMTVLDMCAAPGGKTFTIAEYMNGTGMIYAFDLIDQRAGLIEKGAERLGLNNVTAQAGDASVYNDALPKADRVLCDVPCSGFGVIRRKPEIRYKDEKELAGLPEIQGAILWNAARYVKPEGVLVYSTCTVFREENEQVVEEFLLEHPEFEPVPVLPELHEKLSGSMVTLMPSIAGSDGFFMAKLRRKN